MGYIKNVDNPVPPPVLDGEEWAPCSLLPHLMISSLGRVFSNKHRRLLKGSKCTAGYNQISYGTNGCYKAFVHRLVAIAFIPNQEDKPYVNHIDGNKNNNAAYNLEWATHDENMTHARNTGLYNNIGSDHSRARFKEEDIPVIRKLAYKGMTHHKIAEQYNVSKSAIGHIMRGHTWTHVK